MPENAKIKVLIVDDSVSKREKLLADISACGYQCLTAVDGQDGWEILQAHPENIYTIVLDRVMPRMDGMAFMKKLKSTPALAEIPVIMQTVEGGDQQVIEGIEAGVYYYLPLPYDSQLLLSIVNAAVKDYHHLVEVRASVGGISRVVDMLNDCNFTLRTIDQARQLTPVLASFFPDPERVAMGISELLINAVEHGSLNISYEEKTRLINTNT